MCESAEGNGGIVCPEGSFALSHFRTFALPDSGRSLAGMGDGGGAVTAGGSTLRR
jgi:hypothetical protein